MDIKFLLTFSVDYKTYVPILNSVKNAYLKILHGYLCVFVSFHLRIISLFGEEQQNLTYARHAWPLGSEGSLTCKIYCDTDEPLK